MKCFKLPIILIITSFLFMSFAQSDNKSSFHFLRNKAKKEELEKIEREKKEQKEKAAAEAAASPPPPPPAPKLSPDMNPEAPAARQDAAAHAAAGKSSANPESKKEVDIAIEQLRKRRLKKLKK